MIHFSSSKLMNKIPLLFLLAFSILLNPQHAEAKRTVKAGIYNFKPLVYSEADGSPQGFFVKVLNHVAQKENWDVQYVTGTWQEGLNRLKSDQIDLLLCIGYTEERAKLFDFPKEHLVMDWGLVYKAKGSSINTIMDLEGKTVSALKGSVYTTGFLNLIDQFHIKISVLETNQMIDVFKALESGKAQAGVTANLLGILNETGFNVERTPIIYSPVKLGYGVNKGKNSDLIATLDREMSSLKADNASVYYRELEHILGTKKNEIPKKAYWIVSGIVLSLLVAVAFVISLKRQVLNKTAHLNNEMCKGSKSEESLKLLAQRLQLATSSARLGVWDWNVSENTMTWDERMFELYGVTKESFPSNIDAWLNGLHPDDRERAIEISQQALRGEQEYDTSFRVCHPDGTVLYLKANGLVIRRDDGTPERMLGINYDITEHVLAEELKYRALFDQAAVGVAQLDSMTGRFVKVNQRYADIVGYTPSELCTFSFEDITHPDDLKIDQDNMKELLAGHINNFSIEKRYFSKDGSIVWVLLTVTPMWNPGETPKHHIAVIQDITESKLQELKIQRYMQLLNKTGYIAKIGGWELTLESMELFWSDQTYRLHELNPAVKVTVEDAIGFYTPAARPIIQHAVNAAIESGTPFDLELQICTAMKNLLWVRAQGEAEYVDGKIYKIYGTFQDISEQKITEIRLWESKEQYRTLYENMDEGYCVIEMLYDPDHKPVDFRYIEINPAFENQTGFHEAIGKTIHQLVPDIEDFWIEVYSKVALTGESVRFENQLAALKKFYEVFAFRIGDVESRKVGVLFQDITRRKLAEEEKIMLEQQFQHTQKLESLGVLAGGIAHDFNNILMAIIGNADLALMRINKESPAVDNLKQIEIAAARASDLAKQMLAYSGRGKFIVENINLNNLLEDMLNMLQTSISKKAILRLNLYDHLPTVEADVTQIRQILMNLVINASEAIGEKSGVISITTGCMDCDSSYLKNIWLNDNIAEGLYVYLEVADTGCGMDKETVAKLFDPFFTTKFTGRGLGMSAVLGIVRGHKGAIKVYSEPKKGTTFKILLPASNLPMEIFNSELIRDDWKGSGTVLLVDDEETVRGIGRELLKELGFTTITANNGREAVEIFRSRTDISLVILDLTMPHMDGEQCFRELKKLNPDIKIIMSSGYNEQEVTQRFVGKGLAGFIQKPYKLSDLKETISKI